jgi:hypothetical protein
VGTTDPALRGGYIKMTMLDPHPANNYGGTYQYYSRGTDFLSRRIAAVIVENFQADVSDPRTLVIPENVQAVEVYWQHTDLTDLEASKGFERRVNLWGHAPDDGTFENRSGAMVNRSGAMDQPYNLTRFYFSEDDYLGVTDNPGLRVGVIGHSEVPVWYLYAVVARNRTLVP